MLAGQPFAFALGWAGTWTRLFQSERIAMRFKAAKAAGVLRVRHRFHDAYEVEICARYVQPVSNSFQHKIPLTGFVTPGQGSHL